MQQLHFSIHINAPKEKVWDTIINDTTYREWTKPFESGSYFEGSWEEGSEMRFLSTNSKGGMYARIKENRQYEFISIEHLGMITEEGTIDTTSDEVRKWVPAFENYTLKEVDGGTDVLVDMDINDDYKGSFEKMWPEALIILKDLSEK